MKRGNNRLLSVFLTGAIILSANGTSYAEERIQKIESAAATTEFSAPDAVTNSAMQAAYAILSKSTLTAIEEFQLDGVIPENTADISSETESVTTQPEAPNHTAEAVIAATTTEPTTTSVFSIAGTEISIQTDAIKTTDPPVETGMPPVPETETVPTESKPVVLPTGTPELWDTDSDGNRYYYGENGVAVTDAQTIDGISYLFSKSGVQLTGWQTIAGARWYFDPKSGESVTGFLTQHGSTYYIDPILGKVTGRQEITTETGTNFYVFDDYGRLCHGWIEQDGSYYYADASGILYCGIQTIDGYPYCFSETGEAAVGWQTIQGKRYFYTPKIQIGWVSYRGALYYISPECGKQIGEQQIDSYRYRFDEYGKFCSGFQQFSDGAIRYYTEDGSLLTGLATIADNTYCFDKDGTMQFGFQEQDGGIRYFDPKSGVMQTGFLKLEDGIHYFDPQGIQYTGLQIIDGLYYLFDNAGTMQFGLQTIDNSRYYFDTDSGSMQTGFVQSEGNTYYFAENGQIQTGWQKINDAQYYFTQNGVMLTGMQTIDGKKYRFLENGVLHQVKICLDAGHYGKYNRSPVNKTYYESDMSWKLHLYLKTALESYGIEVITTRPTQAGDLGLEARGKKAMGCDLFLSLHSNACSSSSVDAPLACCTITGKADKLGQQLADTVHNVMGTRQGGTIWKRVGDNGDYYGVLRGAAKVGVPGILLEHSYHTNLRATNWLLVDANLKRMAEAEAAVIAAYFNMT